jgi:hypothetical protein
VVSTGREEVTAVKHRVILDGCLFLLITGILAAVGGCGASSAEDEDATLVRDQRAVAPTRLGPRARQQDAAAKLDTSPLREIEQRVLPRPIVNGPNRHAELPDYYWAENRLLRDRLDNAKEAFRRVPTPAFRALTLVAGAPGVGKTFIKGKVFDKDFPKAAICKFDIRELYDEWASDGIVEDKPDLAADDLVISRLKSVIDKTQPRLREYLELRDASFYVIDSLDEIHPDDHAWILEQVAGFVLHGDRQFIHVAVFARGFAFRDFWNKRKGHPGKANVELHLLRPPTFRTTGDLTVSSWNYHTWKYNLTWAPDGKESSKMPLDAYTRWVDSGFSRQGMFQSVTCEANDSMRPDVRSALVQCAGEYPVVCSALCNLAGNSMIREILQQETLQRRPYDERQITQAYFDAWLTRETKVHDRPSIEQPDHLDLYLSLLERVAVKYLQEGAIDDQGYFSVRNGDSVTEEYESRQRAFCVKRILEGSGLIVTDPREEGHAKYRFEPLWAHRLLAEMHVDRMAKTARLALGTPAE